MHDGVRGPSGVLRARSHAFFPRGGVVLPCGLRSVCGRYIIQRRGIRVAHAGAHCRRPVHADTHYLLKKNPERAQKPVQVRTLEVQLACSDGFYAPPFTSLSIYRCAFFFFRYERFDQLAAEKLVFEKPAAEQARRSSSSLRRTRRCLRACCSS